MTASITSRAGPRRLLLVDDDRISLDLLSLLLAGAGYAVDCASSGEEALASLERGEPDLALLDICMPGMSGLQLAQRLNAGNMVPFMFVTGHQDSNYVRQATEQGALGYVVKPFDPAQLVPAVEAALAAAGEIRRLRCAGNKLGAALSAGRETSMAVGLLMAKFQSDRNTAFNVLRAHARANRRRLEEVAHELLAAEETLNAFKRLMGGHRSE